MHEVDGTGVDVKIGLDGGLLGGSSGEAAATISAATLRSQGPVHAGLEERIVQIEEHCANNDVSDTAVPLSIEIGEGSRVEAETKDLFR